MNLIQHSATLFNNIIVVNSLFIIKFIHLFFRQIKKNTFSSITKLGYGLEINFLSEVVIFRPNFIRSNYFP